MRYTFSLLLLICTMTVQAQQAPPVSIDDTRRAQAPPVTINDIRCNCGFGDVCKCEGNCTCFPEAYSKAIKTGKRLAIFVGVPARKIEGVITVSVPWDGQYKIYPNKSLVVATNYGKHECLYVLGRVSPDTPDDEIRNGGVSERVLLQKKEVQPQAMEFQGNCANGTCAIPNFGQSSGSCANGSCGASQGFAFGSGAGSCASGSQGGSCASGSCGGSSSRMARRR